MAGSDAFGANFKHISYTVSDRVGHIVLNLPAKLNPISHGPGSSDEEIIQALDHADSDEEVRCIVITGAGRAFSAGGDIVGGDTEGSASVLHYYRFQDIASRASERIRGMNKPTIGAINGMCYGAGLVFAMQLDMLVAVDTAQFGMIETRFGGPGVETLPFFVGMQWAKFLALSGELITAQKAKEIGLILETFAPDRFEEKVADLARRVAALPPEGVMLNRRLLNNVGELMGWNRAKGEIATALNTLAMVRNSAARSADGRLLFDLLRNEGWNAFKEARDAAFKTPWLE